MLDNLNLEKIKPLGEKAIDLFVESYSNSARTVQVRGLTANEIISHDHTTNGDRSLATSTISITELPISLTVRTASTGVKRGECFVKVSLRIEGAVVAILGGGYVSDTNSLVFPGGKIEGSTEGPGFIRTVTGSDPVAGAEVLETVPTNARWRLLAFSVVLVTDATVANRVPNFIVDDGAVTNRRIWMRTITNVPASVTRTLLLIQNPGFSSSIGGVTDTQIVNMDALIPSQGLDGLKAGHRIRTISDSLQAGDNFAAPIFIVEEWIEP